jgi:multimeric flavodoxin WrbA
MYPRKNQMKVLGISCSVRKGGNTEVFVKKALAGARDSGAETEFLSIRGKNIRPCDGCNVCEKTGACHIKDDMQPIYEKMLDAEGIVIGTPVYYWSIAGQTKVLIDRTYALLHPRLRLANKVAGAVAVTARAGAYNTLNILERYFLSNHMFPADPVEGLAAEKGDAAKDERGMKSAYEMGRQMVMLMRQNLKFPEEFNVPLYRYIDKKYKVPSYPIQ